MNNAAAHPLGSVARHEKARAEAQPLGLEEDALVERMITCAWRLRRLTRVENGILTLEYLGILAERAGDEARRYEHRRPDDDSKTLLEDLTP